MQLRLVKFWEEFPGGDVHRTNFKIETKQTNKQKNKKNNNNNNQTKPMKL